ncbi:DUF3426 domain-containing protein [Bordetella sp. N]|uniref:DUF3426 domain-containing protein n=1 Tax=Bordetella sp. N TaxID=1746199 RepID=UPI00070C130A|nr:DUF3426 domain-containing protein [Bordetella sp. N]ALM84974.1 hypothetical protein ASB57_20140 [Bordetella sp. N]
MALTTRCPHCGTAFKVVADQLRVRNGLVRCGVCTRVFDGYQAIVDEEMPTLAPTPPAVVPPPPAPVVPPAVVPLVPPPAAAPAPVREDISDAHLWAREQVTPPTAPVPPPVMTPAPVREEMSDAPPWATTPAAPRAVPPAARPAAAPAPVREDISDAHLWAKEPTLPPMASSSAPSETPAVLRGRSDTRRQEPSFVVPEPADQDDDEPLDDDEDIDAPAISAAPQDNPQVMRQRPRPIYVDPSDDQYDDDLHGAVHIYPGDAHRIGVEDQDPDPTAHVSVRGEARTRYDDDVDAGMAPPVFMDEARLRKIALIRRLWAVGCLLALIVLGLQGIYVYRSALATAVPALRPALQSACNALGCDVGYARRIERISITASSLQPPSGPAATEEGVSRLVLSVTLRNRYDKPQPWPALVLELTDLSDTVVVRKVLRPEDYLPATLPASGRAAFPANGEQSISVPLRVAGAQVNGYQLDKFFP